MDSTSETGELVAPSPEVVARLVEGHREFLRFLEARVASRAVAEELLQNAFVRTLEKGGSIREGESAVAWFYRLLRNALVDHYRRNASENRALEREAREADKSVEPELERAVCQCMKTLLPALKAEYAEILERVDLAEGDVARVAVELGITPNNATVRLHRARQALKRALERSCGTCAAHGCLDCNCSPGHCV
jgi:RNA polymerase sigma-70 factor (ECF subfamily)